MTGHNARMKAGVETGPGGDARIGQVVAGLERELGRKARPFSLDLGAAADPRRRGPAGCPGRYLVPEHAYDGPRWPELLRGLLIGRA